jgi:AGZA family xanthine/uracil permease-like MFS transporter
MTRYAWARRGDINAFFGLMLDNVTVMILLVVLITGSHPAAENRYSRDFVLTQMIPGTAIGVLLGDLAYTWMAFRLAHRTGRPDVTAMPLGLDTPSAFAVGPLVLLPALQHGLDLGLTHDQAMVFGWHVGMVVLLLSGIFKTILAPMGAAVRRWVPRAGLLGSLAAIALALIAFVPLWMHIAVVPVVGVAALTVILVALVAHQPLPGRVPGALAAVLLGAAVYFAGTYLGKAWDWPMVPPLQEGVSGEWRLPALLPEFSWSVDWWEKVAVFSLGTLPIMLPFALATVVGGIDCTESAAAAGDEFDTRAILTVEGLVAIAAGLCGGVLQTTPYIGQPAYKAMGGRAAYTLATALFVGLAGVFGWFTHLFDWLPEPAMFPILVFVGLEITAQSFRATPIHHYPALALAALPALAYLALIPVDQILTTAPAPEFMKPALQSLRCLANGFIITSLLWGAALAAILDRRLPQAAAYLAVAGACSLFGIIHSPLREAPIAWPGDILAQMDPSPAIRCQSPYHWAAAYLLAAMLLLVLQKSRKENRQERHDSESHAVQRTATDSAG